MQLASVSKLQKVDPALIARFGPAMTRRLTFRDIFLATTIPLWSRIEVFLLTGARNPVSSAPEPLPAAA